MSINISSISLVGGVVNNKYIRKKIIGFGKEKSVEIFFPIKEMMSDNAAMIAWAGILKTSKEEDIFFKPNPRLRIK